MPPLPLGLLLLLLSDSNCRRDLQLHLRMLERLVG